MRIGAGLKTGHVEGHHRKPTLPTAVESWTWKDKPQNLSTEHHRLLGEAHRCHLDAREHRAREHEAKSIEDRLLNVERKPMYKWLSSDCIDWCYQRDWCRSGRPMPICWWAGLIVMLNDFVNTCILSNLTWLHAISGVLDLKSRQFVLKVHTKEICI